MVIIQGVHTDFRNCTNEMLSSFDRMTKFSYCDLQVHKKPLALFQKFLGLARKCIRS